MPTRIHLGGTAAARSAPTTIHMHGVIDSASAARQITTLVNKSKSLADCKPCQVRREQALRSAEAIATVPPPLPSATPAAGAVTWSGPIVHEGQMTGDARYIEPNALVWGDLPIPLRWVKEDSGEHNGAVVVGRITAIERAPGGAIIGHGDFDTGSAEGIEAARQVGESLTRGVSVDMDTTSFTVRVAKELIDDGDIPGEPAEVPPADADGRVTVLDIDADAEVMVIDDARIRAATLLAVPAFEGARITLDETAADSDDTDTTDLPDGPSVGTTPDGEPCSCDEAAEDYAPDCDCTTDDSDDSDDATVAVTAGAAPVLPPAAWFTDPGLSEPTALTITDDGRIYGHLAAWESCHTGFAHECVTPPRSASGYGFFRTGAVITADNTEVPVGHITLDTFHAGKQLSPADTIAHYEHTGTTVADVAAGDDSHGIWVAGALRPSLDDEQLRSLRSAPLSGDWRRIGGQLELVAALAVNVPGFPVPRTQGVLAASGAMQTLVASGIVVHAGTVLGRSDIDRGHATGPHLGFQIPDKPRTETDISAEALSWLQTMTAPIHNEAVKSKAAALNRRLAADRLAATIHH